MGGVAIPAAVCGVIVAGIFPCLRSNTGIYRYPGTPGIAVWMGCGCDGPIPAAYVLGDPHFIIGNNVYDWKQVRAPQWAGRSIVRCIVWNGEGGQSVESYYFRSEIPHHPLANRLVSTTT